MSFFRHFLIAVQIFVIAGIGSVLVADDFDFSDVDAPEHDYWNRPLRDPFTKLVGDIEENRLGLDTSSEKAYLTGLLEKLEIPVSTQMLVFSTTSLQLSLISPRSPRALYFNEDIYLGYVPGGKIEIVSLDPELGAIFYIFDIPRAGNRPVVERSRRCMNCHSDADTRNVPGLVVKSVIPGPRGGSLDSFRRSITGHQIPLSDRFGGWYLTGADEIEKHWGNAIGQFVEGEIVTSPVLPGERFDWSIFPASTSDTLAHLLHEHQVGFVNRVVELNYRARTFLREHANPSPADLESKIDPHVEEVVKYLLFADEAKFPSEGITGDPALVEAFRATREMDGDGRSLKDFDLESRMFRHRCSYMIYSSLFQGLPEGLKQRIYRRMDKALDTSSPDQEFSYLPPDEKGVIRTILKNTLTDLPEGW
ncbi:MAG: hypothetical protein CMO55_09540 [Verrucomicrobiales bacterium]|nr:hypothetical protein [Verrucomicrobiales bacterium]